MDKKVILQRIELMGFDDYALAVSIFKRESVELLSSTKLKSATRLNALHQLKGMAFSVGLESLGVHVQQIEQMLLSGAEITAEMHLKLLPKRFDDCMQGLDQLLVEISQ